VNDVRGGTSHLRTLYKTLAGSEQSILVAIYI